MVSKGLRLEPDGHYKTKLDLRLNLLYGYGMSKVKSAILFNSYQNSEINKNTEIFLVTSYLQIKQIISCSFGVE